MKGFIGRFSLLIASAFLAASSIFIQLSPTGMTIWGIKENAVFVGALAIFALAAWGILLQLLHLNQQSQGSITHINEAICSLENTQIRRFSFESSFEYLSYRLESSRDVRIVQNTIVGTAVARKIPNYDSFNIAKKKVVMKGTKWFDLITPGLPARGYYALFFAQEVEGDYHLALLDWPESAHNTYQNFITIEGTDSLGSEYREVVFGWESTPAHPDRDDEIIAIINTTVHNRFERHFRNLWELSTKRILSGTVGFSKTDRDGLRGMLGAYMKEANPNKWKKCSKCNTGEIIIFSGFEGHFEVCSNYPLKCNWHKP